MNIDSIINITLNIAYQYQRQRQHHQVIKTNISNSSNTLGEAITFRLVPVKKWWYGRIYDQG